MRRAGVAAAAEAVHCPRAELPGCVATCASALRPSTELKVVRALLAAAVAGRERAETKLAAEQQATVDAKRALGAARALLAAERAEHLLERSEWADRAGAQRQAETAAADQELAAERRIAARLGAELQAAQGEAAAARERLQKAEKLLGDARTALATAESDAALRGAALVAAQQEAADCRARAQGALAAQVASEERAARLERVLAAERSLAAECSDVLGDYEAELRATSEQLCAERREGSAATDRLADEMCALFSTIAEADSAAARRAAETAALRARLAEAEAAAGQFGALLSEFKRELLAASGELAATRDELGAERERAEAAKDRFAGEMADALSRLAEAQSAAERSSAAAEGLRSRLQEAEAAGERSAGEVRELHARLGEMNAATVSRAGEEEKLRARLVEHEPEHEHESESEPEPDAGAGAEAEAVGSTGDSAADQRSGEAEGAGDAGDSTWNAVDGDEEDPADYRIGGYHPVSEGDTYCNGRYKVEGKLGWGQFSTVWLALDVECGDSPVALKISRADEQYSSGSEMEIGFFEQMNEDLQSGEVPAELLAGCGCVLRMRDAFTIDGPNGSHPVMVLEVAGPHLLSLVISFKFRGLPVDIVRTIAKDALEGLAFLHEVVGVAHSDLKPENILLRNLGAPVQERLLRALPPGAERGRLDPGAARSALSGQWQQRPGESRAAALRRSYGVVLSDLGTARWIGHAYPAGPVGTREYRSPENLLGVREACGAGDVWALGCVVYELLTGDYLFDPKALECEDMDAAHLGLCICKLGPLPQSMTRGPGDYVADFFDPDGRFLHATWARCSIGESLRKDSGWSQEEAERFCAFLLPMLRYEPAARTRAKDCCRHPWLTVP